MEDLKIFYLDESPIMTGKYVLRLEHEKFHCGPTIGSFNLIPARLMGISYANFLRLCRDEYGAVIYGKNTAYPVAYFDNNAKARVLIKTLNKLATIVEWERTHQEVLDWAKEMNDGKKD